jgi:prepilin-type N-terminal cleavage/methylation domain-containing protein
MNHRAFTLIELLVVVAIIGILAAVGVVKNYM